MKNQNELNYKDLKMTCNSDVFKFDTTKELESLHEGIGQDRGISALEFGIQVNIKGYNLYLEGPSGVGKTMYTKNYLDKIASKKKGPNSADHRSPFPGQRKERLPMHYDGCRQRKRIGGPTLLTCLYCRRLRLSWKKRV